MPRFAEALDYAATYWYQPCDDGTVAAYHRTIVIQTEYSHFARSDTDFTPADWLPVFLRYNRLPSPKEPAPTAEGLFFIARKDFTLDKLAQHNTRLDSVDMSNFPNRKFICSWYDHEIDQDSGQKPRYTGLDDCAHFISMCLKKQGITNVDSPYAPALVGNLRRRHDTKTLADLVERDKANRIIEAGLVKPGDLLFYGNKRDQFKYWHSSIFLGNAGGLGRVATHTFSNHSKMAEKDPSFNWRINTRVSQHPLTTIIHFSFDDPSDLSSSPMLGWWTVRSFLGKYYYYFDARGRVGWWLVAPSQSASAPVIPVARKGYWFESAADVKICWTETGTFEVLTLNMGPSVNNDLLSGSSNGVPGLSAERGIQP